MAAANFIITVSLGSDFNDLIRKEMKDEKEVASRKWKVYPDKDQWKNIEEKSLLQLRNRISSVCNQNWNFDEEISFAMPGVKDKLLVPSKEADKSPLRLVRARDGWIIDNDRNENSIKVTELKEAFQKEVFQWARTAVFYGIGSYKV